MQADLFGSSVTKQHTEIHKLGSQKELIKGHHIVIPFRSLNAAFKLPHNHRNITFSVLKQKTDMRTFAVRRNFVQVTLHK